MIIFSKSIIRFENQLKDKVLEVKKSPLDRSKEQAMSTEKEKMNYSFSFKALLFSYPFFISFH